MDIHEALLWLEDQPVSNVAELLESDFFLSINIVNKSHDNFLAVILGSDSLLSVNAVNKSDDNFLHLKILIRHCKVII